MTVTKACCDVSCSRAKRKRDQRNAKDDVADSAIHQFVPLTPSPQLYYL